MQSPEFHFSCQAAPDRHFDVHSFQGCEEVDACFRFTISLVTATKNFDPDAFVGAHACLEIRAGKDKMRKCGCVDAVHVSRVSSKTVHLEITLVPGLRRLELTRNYRVFVNEDLKNVLTQVLQACGLQSPEFEFRLTAQPPQIPYLCQYDESDLNFFTRRLEHAGWSYFFEFSDNGDKLVITDSLGQRDDASGDAANLTLPFAPGGSMQAEHDAGVQLFAHKLVGVPGKVHLRDWNYERPDLRLEAECDVQSTGFGQTYSFGDNAATPTGMKHQAKLRAQNLATTADRRMGSSTSPLLLPAQQFTLKGHPKDDHNAGYIPLVVEHWGTSAEQGKAAHGHAKAPGYHNRFAAIRADQTYRPARDTPRPAVHGGVHAFVEAEGEKTYAELDEQGRYYVKLGFDTTKRQARKSSAAVRLMSPHAGPSHGLHFPLLDGAEVLLGHEQGDPDRPFILGTLPNAHAVGPISQKNTTQACIQTAGGNKLKFQDKKDASGLMLFSPVAGAGISLGATPSSLVDKDEATDYDTHPNPPSETSSPESQELLASLSGASGNGSNGNGNGDGSGSGGSGGGSDDPPKPFSGNYFSKDGYNIWTAKNHWLEISAAHSAKGVLGIYHGCYLGLNFSMVAGVLVPSLSTVAGRNVSIFIGSKHEWNTITFHNTWGAKIASATQTKIKGLWNRLFDDKKDASGEKTGSTGGKENVVREDTATRENDSRGHGDTNRVEKSRTNLVNTQEEVPANDSEAREEEIVIIEIRDDTSNTDQQIENSENDMSESRNRESNSETHVFNEKSSTHEENSAIKGDAGKESFENMIL